MSARLAARLGHWSFPIDNLSKISLWEFRFLDTSRSCTGAVDDPQRPVHFDDIGRIEQSDYSFNRIRKQGVIGVEKASNLTRAFCKPKIKCGSLSAIFLKNRDNLVSIGMCVTCLSFGSAWNRPKIMPPGFSDAQTCSAVSRGSTRCSKTSIAVMKSNRSAGSFVIFRSIALTGSFRCSARHWLNLSSGELMSAMVVSNPFRAKRMPPDPTPDPKSSDVRQPCCLANLKAATYASGELSSTNVCHIRRL